MRISRIKTQIRNIFVSALCLAPLFFVTAANAKIIHAVPPGGAVILAPLGQSGTDATFESFEAPEIGDAYMIEDSSKLVYHAPLEIENATEVSIGFTLTGGTLATNDRAGSFLVQVDPNYSANTASATATALEWLFLLLIIALFIEGAVLVLVEVFRLIVRYVWGKAALGQTGPKPSVYKPVYALILSILAVVTFRLDPLNQIVSAFGVEPKAVLGVNMYVFADFVITILLVAGGAESVRRVATGISNGLSIPNAAQMDDAAEAADTRSAQS